MCCISLSQHTHKRLDHLFPAGVGEIDRQLVAVDLGHRPRAELVVPNLITDLVGRTGPRTDATRSPSIVIGRFGCCRSGGAPRWKVLACWANCAWARLQPGVSY